MSKTESRDYWVSSEDLERIKNNRTFEMNSGENPVYQHKISVTIKVPEKVAVITESIYEKIGSIKSQIEFMEFKEKLFKGEV